MTYIPKRPLKPCKVHGCPELTRTRYCDNHAALEKLEKQRAHKEYDKYQRNKKAREFYLGKEWRKVKPD
ncbi:hypothetical protein B1222_03570 [Paenibacillus larvae subsp. pulvifaciens]|nr:hypothetical protein B1222_03570 [Paenibacillus larvae subsp. pulvifaciens]AQZ48841.1 hypothetical protein B5S25_21915 [Paenibacillus larvae subsp. pulvifaciens]